MQGHGLLSEGRDGAGDEAAGCDVAGNGEDITWWQAAQRGNAFVPCRSRDLERIFSLQCERTVDRDNTVSFQNLTLQLERVGWRGTLAGC